MAKDTEKKLTMADFAKRLNKEYNNNNLIRFTCFFVRVSFDNIQNQ